jgi:hypothetical protein
MMKKTTSQYFLVKLTFLRQKIKEFNRIYSIAAYASYDNHCSQMSSFDDKFVVLSYIKNKQNIRILQKQRNR